MLCPLYRLKCTCQWATVKSFHVFIRPLLCGFSQLVHMDLRSVHVKQGLDQITLVLSTGWPIKIIQNWCIAVWLFKECGQQKANVTKLHSHRLDTEQTDRKPFMYVSMYVLVKMRVDPNLMFCFDKQI